MDPRFDAQAFGLQARARRHHDDLSLRDLARQLEVSPSTLCRVEKGLSPDVETYLRIDTWLKTKPLKVCDRCLGRGMVDA